MWTTEGLKRAFDEHMEGHRSLKETLEKTRELHVRAVTERDEVLRQLHENKKLREEDGWAQAALWRDKWKEAQGANYDLCGEIDQLKEERNGLKARLAELEALNKKLTDSTQTLCHKIHWEPLAAGKEAAPCPSMSPLPGFNNYQSDDRKGIDP